MKRTDVDQVHVTIFFFKRQKQATSSKETMHV